MDKFQTDVDEATGARRLIVKGAWDREYLKLFRDEGYTSLWLNSSLGFRGPARLDFLQEIPNLRHLLVLAVGLIDDSAIDRCIDLRTLELTSDAQSTLYLSRLPRLQHVFLNRLSKREDVLRSETVESIYIYGYKGTSLLEFDHMSSLTRIEVGPARNLQSLLGPKTLLELAVSYATGLTTLAGLASMANLRSVQLTACRKIEDLEPLRKLAYLQRVDLSDCGPIRSLAPLENAKLTELFLTGDTKVLDGRVRTVVSKPELQKVGLRAWRHYDITQDEAYRIVSEHAHGS